MAKLCRIKPMDRQRGVALISALLVVMTVFFMVTVMVANMQVELATTRLDSKALQQRYAARAACAEMAAMMSSAGFDTNRYTRANPYSPPGYDPPVKAWLTADTRTANLVHLHAQSGQETSMRVFRRSGVAEAQIFSALVGPGGMRLHSLAMSDLLATRTLSSGNQALPWKPVASPPGFFYNSSGELVEYTGGPSQRYVADLRGGLYSVLCSPEGFAMYRYAGGSAWERMPARPAATLNLAGGQVSMTGGSYLPGAGDVPVWDAARDGSHIWFAENLDPSGAAPSGASFLQSYNTAEQEWEATAIPRLALVPGQLERFTVKDIAAGEDGTLFLLTHPTAACPQSKVVRFAGGTWTVLPDPPRHYYLNNTTLVSESGTLPVDTIAVGPDNTLYTSSPAQGDTHAISKMPPGGGWELGIDRSSQAAALPSRNFHDEGGFRPMSVDAGGKLILGAEGGSAVVQRGSKEETQLTALPSLGVLAEPDEQVWSNIGGGIQGTTSNVFRTTAEY